jgi:rsbT antagonist protein RsbS
MAAGPTALYPGRNHVMTDDRILVVKVREMLLAIVPADPDDATVSLLQEQVLTALERHRVSGLILDISNVDTLDSFFARMVSETSEMVAVMGSQTVVAGMRPSVAITATQLGLNLGSALTAMDIDSAVDVLARSQNGRPMR